MREKNTSDALTWVFKPKTACLTALHVFVLVLTLLAHPPVEQRAVGALP
jgi:hypothetical protein